jgi:glycosyltransferase involved in cell wall biosynthesis
LLTANSETPLAPRISVVMTTYNGAAFIAEQIQSILNQTYADFELLIADDGSTDDTVSVLNRYAAHDGRIKLLCNSRNIGLHKNLEKALRLTRGEFIAIADQDDVWVSDKLERLLNAMAGWAAVYSDSQLVDQGGASLGVTLLQRIGVCVPVQGRRAIVLLRKNCISGHAMLFKRTLLDLVLPFSDELVFDQQIGLMAALSDGVGYLDAALVKHRIHGSNHTNSGLAPKNKDDDRWSREGRVDRYRKRRMDFAKALAYSSVWLQRVTNEPGDWESSRRVLIKMAALSARLQNFENSWFDVRLFFLLLSMRNQIFYEDETNIFQRCLRYAKGAKYYRRSGKH